MPGLSIGPARAVPAPRPKFEVLPELKRARGIHVSCLNTGTVGVSAANRRRPQGEEVSQATVLQKEDTMPNLFDLKKQYAFEKSKAESIVNAAESEKREMTEAEEREYDVAMAAVNAIAPQIAKIQRQNTISQHLVNG